MTATVTSKRTVFRTIAEQSDYYWPYYWLPDTEYTAADLGALEHDVHRLVSVWFKQDTHDDRTPGSCDRRSQCRGSLRKMKIEYNFDAH